MAGTVWVDGVSVGSFTPETQGTTGDFEVDTVDVGDFSFGMAGDVYVDLIIVGSYTADYTPPSAPPDDARYRTKIYLETYLASANLTKDDDATVVNYAVIYANPKYAFNKEFRASSDAVDLLYVIGEPISEPLLDCDQYPYGYYERVPIYTYCVDKYGITGTKLKWKAETELRRITQEHPEGSQRKIEDRIDNDQTLGSTILYSAKFILGYERGLT